jgi:Tfp pilus assembly protein PilW
VSALRLPSRLAREQAGDTLIELVVAAFCGVLVISALAFGFVTGNDSSLSAQRQTELVAAAQQQIESIHQLVKSDGFGALALSSAPPSLSNGPAARYDAATPLNPNSFITSCGSTPAFEVQNNYDSTSEGLVSTLSAVSPCTTAGDEPLVISATNGLVSPGPTQVSEGQMTIDVYTYVTGTSVGCNTAWGSCGNDARRVIVAAVDANASRCSSAGSGNRCAIGGYAPVYETTLFTNPIPSNSPNASVGITLGAQLG